MASNNIEDKTNALPRAPIEPPKVKKEKKHKANETTSVDLPTISQQSLEWNESNSAKSSVTNDVAELEARVNVMLGKGDSKSTDSDIIVLSKERDETNLVQLTNIKLMEANRIFGELYGDTYTPICFTPLPRKITKFKMLIPDACDCIVVENGKAIGVFKAGRYYRSAFYQVAYCVNTRYIPYHFNVTECPTRDNVPITIQIDFLLHVSDSIKFMYDIGPENLEELLRATQAEAVRSLARTAYVESAYDLRGIDSTDMLASLNDKLNPFGVNIDQVTIANVNLPREIAQSLQNSTSYASRTKEQMRLYDLKLRVQQDRQELRLVKQQRKNEIALLIKNSRKERTRVLNEIHEIIAQGEAEIIKAQAELDDKLSEIRANTRLEVAKINAQRDREVNDILTNARMEVQKIKAQSEQYVAKVRAETNLTICENRTKMIEFKGESEKIGAQVLAAQRQYEADLARIGIIEGLAQNRTLISGDAQGNIITQLLVAQRTASAIGVDLLKK